MNFSERFKTQVHAEFYHVQLPFLLYTVFNFSQISQRTTRHGSLGETQEGNQKCDSIFEDTP